MRQRTNAVLLYLNDREAEALERKRRACSMSRSAFLRACILDRPIVPTPSADYAKLYREVNAIGNNINQIAKAANGRVATAQDIDCLMHQLGAVYTLLEGGLRPSP